MRRENKLVIKLGRVTNSYSKLVKECRGWFEPSVAKNLKEENKFKIKDYVKIAKHFNSSHILAFSQSEEHNNLKIISLLENSKTFYFKINKYMFSSEIIKNKIENPNKSYNYSGSEKNSSNNTTELVINPTDLLDNSNNTTETVENNGLISGANNQNKSSNIDINSLLNIGTRMNGYFIIPINIDKNDLITELIEDIKNNTKVNHLTSRVLVVKQLTNNNYLFTNYIIKRIENIKNNQIKLYLVEIGPIMQLELQKIESGICSGEVLYHRYIHKTEEELKEREKKIKERANKKKERKEEQEENIRRKSKSKKRESITEESENSD